MPKLNKNQGAYLSQDESLPVRAVEMTQGSGSTGAVFSVADEQAAQKLGAIITSNSGDCLGMYEAHDGSYVVMALSKLSPDAWIDLLNNADKDLVSLSEKPFEVNLSKPDAMQFKGMTGIVAQAAVWRDGAKEKSNKKKASAALSLAANMVTSRYGTMKNVDVASTSACLENLGDILGVDEAVIDAYKPSAEVEAEATEDVGRLGALKSQLGSVMAQVPELMEDPSEAMENINGYIEKKSTVIDNALKLTGKFLFGLNGLMKGNIPETLLGVTSIIAKFVGFSGKAMPDDVRDAYPKNRHDIESLTGLRQIWGKVDNSMELSNMVDMSRDMGVVKMSSYMANKVQGLMELLANLNFFPAAFQATDEAGNPRVSVEALTAGSAIVTGRAAQMMSDTTVKILDVKSIIKCAADVIVRHVPEQDRADKMMEVVGELHNAMQKFPRQATTSPMELYESLQVNIGRAQKKIANLGSGIADTAQHESGKAKDVQRELGRSEGLPDLAGVTGGAPALAGAR